MLAAMTSCCMRKSLLILGLAIAGCASTPVERTEQSKSAIIGGQPDDAASSVVWIVADVGGERGYCSGVVVSPHVVLTAAHCTTVKGRYSIFLGADWNDEDAKAAPENHVAVVARRTHPDYDRRGGNLHDVGMLITAEEIPRTPALIHREALGDDDVGRPLRVVGFGRTDAKDAATIGRRHAATTTLAEFDAMWIGMVGTPTFCLFDSGGPTFVTKAGKDVVVGIHSIVESASCDATAWDARVDLETAFIDGVIAEADPPTETTEEDATEPVEPSSAPRTSETVAAESSCAVGSRPIGGGSESGAWWLLAAAASFGLRARYARRRVARRDWSRLERR
jgi:V8-like Glu-specific endopeptidase